MSTEVVIEQSSIRRLLEERDLARSVAAQLEAENAQLRACITSAADHVKRASIGLPFGIWTRLDDVHEQLQAILADPDDLVPDYDPEAGE